MNHLDTNVVVRLAGRMRLPSSAMRELRRTAPIVSGPVRFELQLLHESGRLRPTPAQALAAVEALFGLEPSWSSLDAVLEAAGTLSWTRDPMDRLIVGAAMADNARLLTSDTHILEHFPDAVW